MGSLALPTLTSRVSFDPFLNSVPNLDLDCTPTILIRRAVLSWTADQDPDGEIVAFRSVLDDAC